MATPIAPTPKLDRRETIRLLNKLHENADKKEVVDLAESVMKARERRRQQ